MLIRDLTKLANDLDAKELYKEAAVIDRVLVKLAQAADAGGGIQNIKNIKNITNVTNNYRVNKVVQHAAPRAGAGLSATLARALGPVAIGATAGTALAVEVIHQANPDRSRSEILGLAKLAFVYLTQGEKAAWQEWDSQERAAGRPGMTWQEFQGSGEHFATIELLENTADEIETAESPNPGPTLHPVRTEGGKE